MTSVTTLDAMDGKRRHVAGLLDTLARKSRQYEQDRAAPTPVIAPAIPQPGPDKSAEPVRQLRTHSAPSRLQRDWQDVVAPMSFVVGNCEFEVETAIAPARQAGPRGWMIAQGTISGEPFTFHADAAFVELMLGEFDPALTTLPGSAQDAALTLHVIFAQAIHRIEGTTSQVIDIASAVNSETLPDLPWLPVVLSGNHKQASAGLSAGPAACRILEAFAAQNLHPGERNIGKRLRVKIGPVAMSTDQVYRSRPGVTIDCGADPSTDVRGILQQSDGSYWPVNIEDEAVRITGPMQKPLATHPGKGTTLVGLCIGSLEMPHHRRLALGAGQRHSIRRIADNLAEFHVGDKAMMHGTLDVIEGSLVVHLTGTGEAS
jgi:hypothetical protein